MRLPKYISDWHLYVRQEPEKQCKAIHNLVELIENLLKQPGIVYDEADVNAFIDFCKFLKHREGRWKDLPLELEIEQKYIAACVLGIKKMDEELDMWVRYFREMVLIVARKWGKSTFISALALYMECADMEPAAQVWCLATQKDQAEIVFDSAVDFALGSPVLKSHLKKKRDTTGHRLVHEKTRSYMKAGTKDSHKKDGLNPHAVVIDEMHAIRDRNTYDVMSSAMGARTQPLIIIISTAGFERESIYDQKYSQCKEVLKNYKRPTLRIFPMIFEIDTDDDPNDESCWIKSNPGLGERPTLGYLREEYKKAVMDPSMWPSFLAKHMNRPSNASVIYFNKQSVDQCAAELDEQDYTDKYAVGGVDLAETTDLCCATAIIPGNGRLTVLQQYFIASERIEQNSKMDKMAYEHFEHTAASDAASKGLIRICEGPMVRKSHVTEWFNELTETYGLTFWKIGYDRWHGGDWADEMEMNGYPKEDKKERGVTFPVAQGSKTLSTPMKETKALFESGVIKFSRHNGLFRWCVSNTAAKIDSNNNIQPDKARSRARIDGYVSFLCAYIAYNKCKDMFDEYQP